MTGEVGARPLGDGRVAFRVWAPRAGSISLLLDGSEVKLADQGDDFYGVCVRCLAGTDYSFVVDGRVLPDPASRWQPDGLRGPSRVVELPAAEPLRRPPSVDRLVVYELHVGTLTPCGTFDAVIPHLENLAALGVTAIELMPVAEFPGARGWGYDGVYISSAQSSYGGPFGLARLVEAAHSIGLAVILDVVYNHLGTSGVESMEAFGPYFTPKYETPWGRAMNYDDADCEPVRQWACESAVGWIRDFGIDGLRLDAIHAIADSSPEHIVAAIARRVHEVSPSALVIGELGLDDPAEFGAPACDALWRDQFHHALHALLTGERDGYYAAFGRVEDLAAAFESEPAVRTVVYAQNHDQVGNRAFGDRLAPELRPLAAFCTVLSPFAPLLFMGEEYGEPAPFQFFSDHIDGKIAEATRTGRRREFASFARFDEQIPDPQELATFERSRLTRRRDPFVTSLYEQLLAARRRLGPAGGSEVAVEFDESERWLRVRRSSGTELVCNFSADVIRSVPCGGSAVELSTLRSDVPVVSDGRVELPPLSGALIR
jgi:maltooligosyltrehalose trehalohydrolase